MKKILFVIDTLQGAGAEKVLITILNNLDYSKYKVDLLLIFNYGEFLKEVPKQVKIINIFNNFNYKSLKKIYSIIFHKLIYKKYIKTKYDIEIAFLDASPVFFVSHSWNKNSKKIVWIHTDRLKSKTIIHKIQNDNLYREFNKIICVSEEVKKSFINLYKKINPNKLISIHNPVDIKDIIKKGSVCKNNSNIITFVSTGRLTNAKGYDILLNVHKRLLRDGLKHQVLILGQGEDKNKLKEMIKEYKLEKSFKLLGFRENPYMIIKNADVFVCSSRYEGFSIAIVEAMALGKPIISMAAAGPIELLGNGEFGLLVENSKQGLYNGIKKLILSEDLRNYYAKKSLERRDFFDIKKSMKEVEDLFDNI